MDILKISQFSPYTSHFNNNPPLHSWKRPRLAVRASRDIVRQNTSLHDGPVGRVQLGVMVMLTLYRILRTRRPLTVPRPIIHYCDTRPTTIIPPRPVVRVRCFSPVRSAATRPGEPNGGGEKRTESRFPAACAPRGRTYALLRTCVYVGTCTDVTTSPVVRAAQSVARVARLAPAGGGRSRAPPRDAPSCTRDATRRAITTSGRPVRRAYTMTVRTIRVVIART